MKSDTPILEAQAIGRRRSDGSGWLLRDVSLRLDAGECLGVVGPTGAGKTVLLRALAQLDPLDTGQVCWRGQSVRASAMPRFRRSVIYLHQRGQLGEGQVESLLRQPFELEVHRHSRFDRQRIESLLNRLGPAAEFLDQLRRDLSGGEAQLVALLRALQLDPQVLLLDEPTAALDPASTRSAEEVLGGWVRESREGRALVWVSHDQAQTDRVASRRLALRGGRLEAARESPAR